MPSSLIARHTTPIKHREDGCRFLSRRCWRGDLLRTSEALHLTTEFDEYRRAFPDTTWVSRETGRQLAQVVVISYNGRAPRKEDQYLDLPISLSALQLVLLNKGVIHYSHRQPNRAADSILYGLSGRVVRVALPRLIPQKTLVTGEHITLTARTGTTFMTTSQLVHNTTALAEKALSERLPSITTKALARAAVKFAAAEAAMRGAQQAVNKDDAAWVGLVVGLLTKGLAIASEEADKRSWRTLPDEIQIARVWVPAGEYDAHIKMLGHRAESVLPGTGGAAGIARGRNEVSHRTSHVMNGRRYTSRTASLLIFCIVIVCLIAACSWWKGKGRPDWIDGTSITYPPSQYLVGVGQSERRTGAEEQAYAALAKFSRRRLSPNPKTGSPT